MSQLTFGETFQNGEPASAVKTPSKKESWYKGRVLSHSSISTYQVCPQKWKFRYVDKIPERPRTYFSFGKSVHAGLEYLFANTKTEFPSLDDVLAQFQAGWIRDGYESPAQERWFFKEGERILRGFYEKHKKDIKEVFKVELKFQIDIEGVPLMGFIDRVDKKEGNQLAIVDYKTGKAFDKSRVRSDPQLTLYQMAVRQLFDAKINTVTLYHLNSLTPVTVPAHGSHLEEKLTGQIIEVAKGIQQSAFDPKPDARGHCQWCDYVQICPAFAGKKIPLSLKPNLMPASKEIIDRYGKLNERIAQLSEEGNKLKDQLRAELEKAGDKKLAGDHYQVELKPHPTGGAPLIHVSPLKAE